MLGNVGSGGVKIGKGHFRVKKSLVEGVGVLKHTITADITYPGCQGNLNNNRDKTHHNQRKRMFSMAAIPRRVELLSSINMLHLFNFSLR